MATTHPRLLKLFVSKSPVFVGLKIVPVVVVLVYLLTQFEGTIINAVAFAALGVAFWSLFEYCVHRWVYHIQYKRPGTKWFLEAFHLHHHRDLTDHRVLNAGWLLIYPITFTVWGIVWLLSGDIFIASSFSMGTIAYYWFYEMIHYAIHYKVYKSGYLEKIQKYHLYHHHRKWNANYGNTIVLWDRVFGTYDEKYKLFEVDETVSKDFITEINT